MIYTTIVRDILKERFILEHRSGVNQFEIETPNNKNIPSESFALLLQEIKQGLHFSIPEGFRLVVTEQFNLTSNKILIRYEFERN